MMNFTRILVALVLCVSCVRAFLPCPASLAKASYDGAITPSAVRAPMNRATAGALRMGWGDALGKAFANEEMAPNKNPGLKNEAKKCMVRSV